MRHISNWCDTKMSWDDYGYRHGYYQVQLIQLHGVVVGHTYRYVSFDSIPWC